MSFLGETQLRKIVPSLNNINIPYSSFNSHSYPFTQPDLLPNNNLLETLSSPFQDYMYDHKQNNKSISKPTNNRYNTIREQPKLMSEKEIKSNMEIENRLHHIF